MNEVERFFHHVSTFGIYLNDLAGILANDLLVDIHAYHIPGVIIIIAKVEDYQVVIFLCPAHEFVVVHFRYDMMPAEGFTVFIDLLAKAHSYWFHAVFDIDHRDFMMQLLSDLLCLCLDIAFLSSQQGDSRCHILYSPVGDKAEVMKGPELCGHTVSETCPWGWPVGWHLDIVIAI